MNEVKALVKPEEANKKNEEGEGEGEHIHTSTKY